MSNKVPTEKEVREYFQKIYRNGYDEDGNTSPGMDCILPTGHTTGADISEEEDYDSPEQN